MDSMKPEKLVIFDYSGTLSLNAVLFARPEYLAQQLEDSGLAALGVADLDFFWQEIVNATWTEGSTTGIGYAGVIATRLRELGLPNGESADPSKILTAAARFVHSYLSHSMVDRRWQPLLAKLVQHPATCVIIATDHYAEATNYLVQFLQDLAIPARPAGELFERPDHATAVVANSADLGFPKADRHFWEVVRDRLGLATIRQTLCVDDFGYHESERDDYGTLKKVEERQATTTQLLRAVFAGNITIFPFLMPRGTGGTSFPNTTVAAYHALIEETVERIRTWVAEPPES